MMPPFVAYWEPKAGTARSEWEDGCAYSSQSGWFAITDGASAGTSSREWAFTLAKAFVDDRREDLLHDDDGLRDRFRGWLDGVRSRFDPEAEGFAPASVPDWVRAAGEARGAFCTFLGGRITPEGWAAIAVGDCCLFHVEAGDDHRPADPTSPVRLRLATTFPLSGADSFGSTPGLIPSTAVDDDALARSLRHGRGPLGRHDVVLVGTDAVAEWMLGAAGGDDDRWRLLHRIDDQGFAALCADLRERRAMRNDDVTLLRHTPPARPGGG